MKPEQGQCLKQELIRLLLDGGAMVAGVADLTTAGDTIATCADRRLLSFPRAVSFAVAFPRSVIDELAHGPSHTYLHYYRAVNTLIDELSLRLTTVLEVRGLGPSRCLPHSVRASIVLTASFPTGWRLTWPALAGWARAVAWLMKRSGLACVLAQSLLMPCCRLKVRRLSSAVTAPPAGTHVPAGAIKGRLFSPDVPLLERLNPSLCDTYQDKVRDRFGKRVCGLCLAACPFGRTVSQPDDSKE
jgi:epoxyqueuosine reductase